MMMFTLGGVNLVTQIINNLKSFIAIITVKNLKLNNALQMN
jgi:hypothetical protein